MSLPATSASGAGAEVGAACASDELWHSLDNVPLVRPFSIASAFAMVAAISRLVVAIVELESPGGRVGCSPLAAISTCSREMNSRMAATRRRMSFIVVRLGFM